LHKHNNQFLFFLLARWQIGKIVFACWFVAVVAAVAMLPLLCCSCAGTMRALHCERRRRDRDDNDDYQQTTTTTTKKSSRKDLLPSLYLLNLPQRPSMDGWMEGWIDG
jgi:hypothetical protein